jgi:hypothetical protein
VEVSNQSFVGRNSRTGIDYPSLSPASLAAGHCRRRESFYSRHILQSCGKPERSEDHRLSSPWRTGFAGHSGCWASDMATEPVRTIHRNDPHTTRRMNPCRRVRPRNYRVVGDVISLQVCPRKSSSVNRRRQWPTVPALRVSGHVSARVVEITSPPLDVFQCFLGDDPFL